VRPGFAKARHELITILDADLTMPPEMLPRFYNAYCSGLADFVNGTRLVYPIEGEAMGFLNRLESRCPPSCSSKALANKRRQIHPLICHRLNTSCFSSPARQKLTDMTSPH